MFTMLLAAATKKIFFCHKKIIPDGSKTWLFNSHQITLMFEHEKIFFQTENKNSVWVTFLHSSQSLISTTFYQKIPISEKVILKSVLQCTFCSHILQYAKIPPPTLWDCSGATVTAEIYIVYIYICISINFTINLLLITTV